MYKKEQENIGVAVQGPEWTTPYAFNQHLWAQPHDSIVMDVELGELWYGNILHTES
jgi:hypothetical protein